MDKVDRYREIIYTTLMPLAERRYSGDKATNEAVFDKENDRYIIVSVGWLDSNHRVYFNLVHLDIINGKVWIQYDGTEDGIGYALEAAGIPKRHCSWIPPGKCSPLYWLWRRLIPNPFSGYGVILTGAPLLAQEAIQPAVAVHRCLIMWAQCVQMSVLGKRRTISWYLRLRRSLISFPNSGVMRLCQISLHSANSAELFE